MSGTLSGFETLEGVSIYRLKLETQESAHKTVIDVGAPQERHVEDGECKRVQSEKKTQDRILRNPNT